MPLRWILVSVAAFFLYGPLIGAPLAHLLDLERVDPQMQYLPVMLLGIAGLALTTGLVCWNLELRGERKREERREAQLRRQEEERQRARAEQERQRRFDLVSSLPRSALRNWDGAVAEARRAQSAFQNLRSAFEGKRMGEFYTGVFDTSSHLGRMASEIDFAGSTLVSYDKQRQEFQLPPAVLKEQEFAPLVQAMRAMKADIDQMVYAAEAVPEYVQIRLMVEGNRQAALHHSESIEMQTKLAEAVGETNTRLSTLEDSINHGFDRLDERIHDAAEMQVNAVREASERQAKADAEALKVAQGSEEHAQRIREAVHDIHKALVPPGPLNKYKRSSL